MSDYDYWGQIDPFEEYVEGFKQVTPAQISEAVQTICTQGRWGLSLVGDITEDKAQELHQIIKPIWQ